MKHPIFSMIVLFASLQSIVHASYRPVAVLSAGADVVPIHMNQNIIYIEPFQNHYVGNNTIVDFVGGIFLGIETSLCHQLLAQLGVSYYQNADYQVQGLIYQFADPSMGNLNYQYNIQSKRVLLEAKALGTLQNVYHPFLTLGFGETANHASQYTEIPVTTADVTTPQGFANKTKYAFTYLIGVGVDVDVTNHIRLGGAYRYVNLGRAQLGASLLEVNGVTLKNNSLYANEFLLQLTYLG